MKRWIHAASDAYNTKQIQVGDCWNCDDDDFKAIRISPDRKTCETKRRWFSRDDLNLHDKDNVIWDINVDEDGKEYMTCPEFPGWKLYCGGRAYLSGEWVDEDDYTPSATRHDYSPSNPWDAPGMSKSDFI